MAELEPNMIGADAKNRAPFGVLCPSVMVKFYLRTLDEPDAAKLAADLEAGAFKRRDIVITATLCNADGGRNFNPETIAAIRKLPNADAEKLHRKACEINGVEYIPTKAK